MAQALVATHNSQIHLNSSLLPSNISDLNRILLGKTICIEGGIAAGKSEFVKRCSGLLTAFGIKNSTICEEIDMFLLDKFNQEPARYATLFQQRMMTSRLISAVKAREKSLEKDSVVLLDTGIMRELAFSSANLERKNMSAEAYEAHMRSFSSAFRDVGEPMPDVILLLDCPAARAKDNVAKRNRGNENLLTVDYLESIREHYLAAAEHPMIKGKTKVIAIDVSKEYAPLSILDSVVNAIRE